MHRHSCFRFGVAAVMAVAPLLATAQGSATGTVRGTADVAAATGHQASSKASGVR